MELALSPDRQAIRDAFVRVYEKESPAERVRDAEHTGGFDRRLWDALVAMGAPTMGAPEDQGGGGASLAELVEVATIHGAHLGSAPLIEAMVASRLLAGAGAADAVTRLCDGEVIVWAPRPLQAAAGELRLVPAGAIADAVVGGDGDEVVLVRGSRRPIADLGHASTGDVEVETVDRLGSAPDLIAEAQSLWRLLTAAALVGLGRTALGLGVAYVTERRQFGVPIGSFQAVQHRLADVATGLDGAGLLVERAAWAADRGDGDAAAFATMAYAFAGEWAQQAAQASLHFHGGYGFMEEYDIQLYARRAKAWVLAGGDPRREYQRLADQLYGPVAAAGAS